jgi:hypothetical protein
MNDLRRLVLRLSMFLWALAPAQLSAQGGCGGACLPCAGAPSSAWKYGGLNGTNHLAFCTPSYSCVACNFTSRESSIESKEKLSIRFRRSSTSAIEGLVALHGKKIRTMASRNALLVLGGCDGTTPTELSHLPTTTIERLKRLGVQEWDGRGESVVAVAKMY